MELSSSIITWHKITANKWSNTVEWCNCRSATVMMGATLLAGATVKIDATLVDGITLEIGEWCTCRRRYSVDWHNTLGRRNTGDWRMMHLMRRNSEDWYNTHGRHNSGDR